MYTVDEIKTILKRSSKILNVEITDDASTELARRSRGTPRIANRILRRVRDFIQVDGKSVLEVEDAKRALDLMDIDNLGLDYTDKKVLEAMIQKFDGGPVGLDTLAASTGEESTTIEDVIEPYLLQLGFIARTPRGRVVLRPAYEHFGIPVPKHLMPDEQNNE